MASIFVKFPLLIAKLEIDPDSGFTVGELRLLVKSKIESENKSREQFDCDVLLLRMMDTDKWQLGGRSVRQEVSGGATLTEQDDGSFVAEGTFIAALTVVAPKEEEARAGAPNIARQAESQRRLQTFRLAIPTDNNKRGPWLIKVSLHIAEESGVAARDIDAKGEARLYPEKLPALDASGSIRGQYYLPVVPVVPIALGDGQASTPTNSEDRFSGLLEAANSLWLKEAGVSVLSESPRVLPVNPEIIMEANSGVLGNLDTALSKALLGGAGVPIVLIDGLQSGQTELAPCPMRTRTVLGMSGCDNRMLLAHEVGHVLGGMDDGKQEEVGRWAEDTLSPPSVMRPTQCGEGENPARIGERGKMFAHRWALFKEQPADITDKVLEIFRRMVRF